MTKWHSTKPDFKKFLIDGFILTQCIRRNGGWLCMLDDKYFKFPSGTGKGKRPRSEDEGVSNDQKN
ncbi:MAG: hypothetical protein AAB367_02410 [Patescibacteria group bacterium]